MKIKTFLAALVAASFFCASSVEAQHDNHPSPATPPSTSFANQPNSQGIFDTVWQTANWVGTGGNFMSRANATITPTPACAGGLDAGDAPGGYLNLKVSAGVKTGSEIQTLNGKNGVSGLGPAYGFGFYAARMKVTPISGTVASFFWIGAPNYSGGEWDIEFLTNESPRTKVHFTEHPSNRTFLYDLGFDWSAAYHEYGFLWTSGTIVYTVDRKSVHTSSSSELATTTKGFIMANVWTGNPNWGGGPPTQDAVTCYPWIRHWPGATSIP